MALQAVQEAWLGRPQETNHHDRGEGKGGTSYVARAAGNGEKVPYTFFYCILGFGVHVQNLQDSCIGTHVAV